MSKLLKRAEEGDKELSNPDIEPVVKEPEPETKPTETGKLEEIMDQEDIPVVNWDSMHAIVDYNGEMQVVLGEAGIHGEYGVEPSIVLECMTNKGNADDVKILLPLSCVPELEMMIVRAKKISVTLETRGLGR